MPKNFTSKTQKIGEIGENIAVKFLMKHGFSVLDRNYTKKWGEIDIVAENNDKLFFIEVKSVSRDLNIVTHETLKKSQLPVGQIFDNYRPEENMHPWKMKRLSRTIQTYLLAKKIPDEKEYQVDLLIVYLDLGHKKAKIKLVNDIIL